MKSVLDETVVKAYSEGLRDLGHDVEVITTDLYTETPFVKKEMPSEVNGINVRLYGCFGSSEDPNRFLAINIKNYINKKPIKIFKNRQMDFMYVKDIYKNTLYAIENNVKDINCVYEEKKYLTDIADVVNHLDNHSVDVIVENEGFDSPYTINAKPTDIKYIGLEKGIQECYEDYLC